MRVRALLKLTRSHPPCCAGFSLFGFGKSDDVQGKVVSTGKGAKDEEELSEGKQLMQKVKDAGAAGIISYIFWEWAFWGVSVPVALFGFQAATGYCTRARSARLERKFGNGSVSACGGIAQALARHTCSACLLPSLVLTASCLVRP